MVVSKLITRPFWLTLLLPRPWALHVSACEACGGTRHHHTESAQHYGDDAAQDPSSFTPPQGEGEQTGSGNSWRLDYGIAGMAEGQEREGSRRLSVLQGGMSWGWPLAGWSCTFCPQAASFCFLAALPKWCEASETQMAGSRAWGFGALGELNLKASLAQSPLYDQGFCTTAQACSEGLKMHTAPGLQVYAWVCAGNVLSLMFLSARVQKLHNESFAQRKGNRTEEIFS